ncbi:MAG: tetratricopeptide repeat protein [Terriglobia bacterium]
MRFSAIHHSVTIAPERACIRSARGRAAVCLGVWLAMMLGDPGLLSLRAAETVERAEYEMRGEVTIPPRTLVSRRARLYLTLIGVTAPFRARAWADHRGRFRMKRIPPATYTLSIYVPGVGEILQTVEITESFADAAGRIHKQFVFDEETLRNQARAVITGVVSVRELSIPGKARGEFRKAQGRLRARRVEDAIRHLERAVELAPQFIEAMNNLGTVHFQKNDYAGAERYFRRALELEPDAFEPLVNLGGVLLATGSASEAMEFNRRAQELRPHDALANAQLGLSYFRLGDFNQALEYLQHTKELDPAHFTNPQIALARIYMRRSQREAAVRELEEFLEQHPDSPEAGNVRATIEQIQESRSRSASERLPL